MSQNEQRLLNYATRIESGVTNMRDAFTSLQEKMARLEEQARQPIAAQDIEDLSQEFDVLERGMQAFDQLAGLFRAGATQGGQIQQPPPDPAEPTLAQRTPVADQRPNPTEETGPGGIPTTPLPGTVERYETTVTGPKQSASKEASEPSDTPQVGGSQGSNTSQDGGEASEKGWIPTGGGSGGSMSEPIPDSSSGIDQPTAGGSEGFSETTR